MTIAINNGNNCSIDIYLLTISLFFTSWSPTKLPKETKNKKKEATTTTTNTRIIIWAEELQNPRQRDGWEEVSFYTDHYNLYIGTMKCDDAFKVSYVYNWFIWICILKITYLNVITFHVADHQTLPSKKCTWWEWQNTGQHILSLLFFLSLQLLLAVRHIMLQAFFSLSATMYIYIYRCI